MEIKIYAESESGKKRYIEDCICDSPVKAIQMYEDECRDDEVITYEIKGNIHEDCNGSEKDCECGFWRKGK